MLASYKLVVRGNTKEARVNDHSTARLRLTGHRSICVGSLPGLELLTRAAVST